MNFQLGISFQRLDATAHRPEARGVGKGMSCLLGLMRRPSGLWPGALAGMPLLHYE